VPAPSDGFGMDRIERKVACLSCGHRRLVSDDPGECPRCQYLGWTPVLDLSETLRRRLRFSSRRVAPPERKAS